MLLKSLRNWGILAIVLGLFLWLFPPFRIVRLASSGPVQEQPADKAVVFDARASAIQIWEKQLVPAAETATDLGILLPVLSQDPGQARTKHGHSAGLGAAYYFVQGSGKVVSRSGSGVQVQIEGDKARIISLRIGPVFGNVLRDGCGLLDLNRFPGLQEFNALAAELNALSEARVIPLLREQALVGTSVRFAGCAEAPEALRDGAPLLTIIPVQASLK